MAFLDVLTRHMPQSPARKYMLRANHACLQAQSDPDYKHWLLTDEVGQGWQHAAETLVTVAPKLKSRYVMILDDDDLMINWDGIRLLKGAAESNPAAVICRGWHGDLGVLPGPDAWERRPRLGTIGSFDFIIRRDLFGELAAGAVSGGYCNDFFIIDGIFERDQQCQYDESAGGEHGDRERELARENVPNPFFRMGAERQVDVCE